MKHPLAALLAAHLLVSTSLSAPPVQEGELARGIRQVQEGDFETAVLTLDALVRVVAKTADASSSRDMAQAYLYLGVAYVGLDRSETAKGKFQEALRLDPELRVGEEHFSAKVVRVFEAARAEMAMRRLTSTAANAAGRPPSPRPIASPSPGTAGRKGRSKGPLILLGVAGAGAGVAVAVSGGGGSGASPRPPTPSVTIEASSGGAITGVTVITFTASATNLTSSSFTWNFGDGATATTTAGSAQHRFDSEGTFNVVVTATGTEGTATASRSVVSRTLTGGWSEPVFPCPSDRYCRFFNFVQQGTLLTGTYSLGFGNPGAGQQSGTIVGGAVSSPLQVTWAQSGECQYVFTGTVSSDLNSIGTTAVDGTCTPGDSYGPIFRRR